MHSVVTANYLEEDLAHAVSRYAESREFSRICALLAKHLAADTRLVEVGAGRGLLSLALARKRIPVISLEYDPSEIVGLGALKQACRVQPARVTPVRGDILELPFRSESIDIVVCRGVLHHLVDLRQGFTECRRVLRPNGLFLGCNEHVLAPYSNGQEFIKAHPAVAYGVDERAYSWWTYKREARKAGFARVRLIGGSCALDLSEFLNAVRQYNRIRAWMIAITGAGPLCASLLYALHKAIRRSHDYLSALFPDERTLAAISFVAQKV